jgi:hypothetical protein
MFQFLIPLSLSRSRSRSLSFLSPAPVAGHVLLRRRGRRGRAAATTAGRGAPGAGGRQSAWQGAVHCQHMGLLCGVRERAGRGGTYVESDWAEKKKNTPLFVSPSAGPPAVVRPALSAGHAPPPPILTSGGETTKEGHASPSPHSKHHAVPARRPRRGRPLPGEREERENIWQRTLWFEAGVRKGVRAAVSRSDPPHPRVQSFPPHRTSSPPKSPPPARSRHGPRRRPRRRGPAPCGRPRRRRPAWLAPRRWSRPGRCRRRDR